MAEPYSEARVLQSEDGKTYVIRDVWDNGCKTFWSRSFERGAKLLNCEYAVVRDGKLEWRPCAEGVMFTEIEPIDA